jgi:hypothetical protein
MKSPLFNPVQQFSGQWPLCKSTLVFSSSLRLANRDISSYAIGPLCGHFQPYPVIDEEFKTSNREKAKQTSLLIPCYKSGAAIGATLEAALKTFPRKISTHFLQTETC